ncbi:glycoside hydrolase family 47 protein [Xylaria sp. CBS 124048]|nr:glycoside hydrolase family 47 protein [Xylaria sp. CBS 124048]
MYRCAWALAGLGSVVSAAPLSSRGPAYITHQDRLDGIKAVFQTSWDGYFEFAFPNDSLQPLTKTFVNDRNGWGASAVDAISTAIIMGNTDVVNIIVEHIKGLDFTRTVEGGEQLSLFETTIRYLAGMLSAYDFLTGPFAGQVDDESVQALLDQATTLADALSVAFNTPTGIPINDLVFNGPNGPVTTSESTNGIAQIGSLILEFTRLSDLTGDDKYANLTLTGEQYLLNIKNPEVGEPYPGLLGTNVNVNDGTFADGSGGWNGGDDSFYEYLIKMYMYDTERFASFKDRWTAAVNSSMTFLASHPTSNTSLTFLAAYNGAGQENLSFSSGHLACFDGGNIILGGLTLDNQDYIDFGLKLVEACHATYIGDATRIGPEGFSWQDSVVSTTSKNNPAPPADWASFYDQNGYWITSSAYVLRPEVLESYYYAYRATGDSKYQDWSWDAFTAINKTCRAGVGYSAITDVNSPNGGSFSNSQESFWFAEVLKYSYLTQAGDAPYQVNANHDNQWVYNTESHPFRVAGKPI